MGEGEAWTDAAAACLQVLIGGWCRSVVYRYIGRSVIEAAGQAGATAAGQRGCNGMQWVVGTVCRAGVDAGMVWCGRSLAGFYCEVCSGAWLAGPATRTSA